MTTKKKTTKQLTPREAKTFCQICSLPGDGIGTKWGWFSIDVGIVSIFQQELGKDAVAEIEIPRRDFNKFVDWYNTGRITKRRAVKRQ